MVKHEACSSTNWKATVLEYHVKQQNWSRQDFAKGQSYRPLIDHHRKRFTIGDGIASTLVALHNLFCGILLHVLHLMTLEEDLVEDRGSGSTHLKGH